MAKYHVAWTYFRLLASQCRQKYGVECSFENSHDSNSTTYNLFNDAIRIITNTASNNTIVSEDELPGRWKEKVEE